LTQKRDSSDKNAAEDDVSMSSADALRKEALIEKKGYNMCTEILDFEVLCHAILYYVQNMAQVISVLQNSKKNGLISDEGKLVWL